MLSHNELEGVVLDVFFYFFDHEDVSDDCSMTVRTMDSAA